MVLGVVKCWTKINKVSRAIEKEREEESRPNGVSMAKECDPLQTDTRIHLKQNIQKLIGIN